MKNEEFAKRFKQAVKYAGVPDTQDALGKLFGVSGVTIWSYRNGDKLPRMKRASEMARILGVNVNWLMTGEGQMVDSNQLTEEEIEILKTYREAVQEDQLYLLQTTRLVGKKGKPEQKQ